METIYLTKSLKPAEQEKVENFLAALQTLYPGDLVIAQCIKVETDNPSIANLLYALIPVSQPQPQPSNGKPKAAEYTVKTKSEKRTVSTGHCPGCNRDNVQIIKGGYCRACTLKQRTAEMRRIKSELSMAGEPSGFAISEPAEMKASRLG